MAKAFLGLEQAAELVGRMKAAAEGRGRFSDIVMPNGQKLSDCTFGYIAELGEAMQSMGLMMPEPLHCSSERAGGHWRRVATTTSSMSSTAPRTH
jgi:hypothetical protein